MAMMIKARYGGPVKQGGNRPITIRPDINGSQQDAITCAYRMKLSGVQHPDGFAAAQTAED
ncbi:hypothetical protein Q0601_06610 [Paracoccus onubensis]|uniref:hypothetical protein n=1 Tax=Paracoccus onubensis TaxID=1675788 RepID=UPI00273021AD|nr:hypothetical protein [Paracoccus onubensis]MDP0926834.1 hypothetical protein [Paracoccus onubensis]